MVGQFLLYTHRAVPTGNILDLLLGWLRHLVILGTHTKQKKRKKERKRNYEKMINLMFRKTLERYIPKCSFPTS